ncbi:MAG: UDP-3-O-(3-hydroxymyristoyl)glucosamine N-acyltransferase [Candidatus Phaeomarinobacter sp.]
MADPRFFTKAGPFSLEHIAQKIGAKVEHSDGSREISDVAPLDSATAADISFFDNPRYKDALEATKAGAVIIASASVDLAPEGVTLLVTDAPYPAYASTALLFYPHASHGTAEVSPAAHVDPSARLGADVDIAPGAVVGANVEIGQGSSIGANTVIGRGVQIGRECAIAANVTLSHALVGDRVIIHPGARIGQDGFGFAMGPNGHQKIPQLGRVIIQDDVDIGSNTTIDRGAGPDTVIGEGSKIDNQVQLAHNVSVGQGCVIVSQVGISGSAKLGNYVVAGGQVGIAGHLEIGDGAMLAARTGVPSDLEGGQQYGGTPARPMSQWRRELAAVAILAKRKKKKKA